MMVKTHCDLCDATPATKKLEGYTEHSVGHIRRDVQITVTFTKRYDDEDLELCAECQRLIIKKVVD